MLITPPVRATARSSLSERLRLLSHVPFTPVWETTTGFVARAVTSRNVAGDAWAKSISMCLAFIRCTHSRPSSVNPPLLMPAAAPPMAVTRQCDDSGEGLNGDVSFHQPRQIDVADGAAAQKISPPEQAVSV